VTRPPNRFRIVRAIAAALLAVSAIRHTWLALHGDESVPRHWLFVGINVGLAILLVRSRRWALPATLLLSIQQMWSHGTELVRSIHGPGPFDWSSLGVCVFFPVLIVVLALERRA
jgi:hypothetical protein